LSHCTSQVYGFKIPFMCQSMCLKFSFYLKYRRTHTSLKKFYVLRLLIMYCFIFYPRSRSRCFQLSILFRC
jgi:hypothetical protein